MTCARDAQVVSEAGQKRVTLRCACEASADVVEASARQQSSISAA